MTKLSDLNILDVGNTIQLEGAIFVGNGKMYLCDSGVVTLHES